MMKTKLLATCILLGAVLAPLPGHSEGAKAFVKDSVITAKIKADYAKDKEVSALHIKVDTDSNGVVHLSGKAKTQAEADKAVSIANAVEGVKSVNSNIQVMADR